MHSTDEVIFVLQVMLGLGPVALYFLCLGLVNSQLRPRLIPSRADFILLGFAVVPLLVALVSALVAQHQWLPAMVCMVGAMLGYLALMPRSGDAWVVYNIDPQRCAVILENACRRLGWSMRGSSEQRVIGSPGLSVRQEALACLRNVTVQIQAENRPASRQARAALIRQFQAELTRETQLPSATGAALVLVGVSLLGLPMWFALRHAETIVNAVRQWFFA